MYDVAEQYIEKRLRDYGYAKWASAEPDIWFVVYGEEKMISIRMFQGAL